MAEAKVKEKRESPQEKVRKIAEAHGGEYLKPQLVKMSKKGDFVVGKLITVEQQESKMIDEKTKKEIEKGAEVPMYNIYHLEENKDLSPGNRGMIAITGSASLDNQMREVKTGDTVVIQNEGKVDTSAGFKANVVTVIKLTVK